MGRGVSQKIPPSCIAALLKKAPGDIFAETFQMIAAEMGNMKRKLLAFAATMLTVLALVGFSGGVPKQNTEPAQAWYYSSCTPIDWQGYKWCYRVCTFTHERWSIGHCAEYVRVSVWGA